jgi:superfamily II DNA or RNA helicase
MTNGLRSNPARNTNVTLKDSEITAINMRLAELDAERASLLKRLSESQTPMTSDSHAVALPSVTTESRGREKIELFRRLFSGRQDVFPLRWENPKTGRSGYSPACYNEWKPGICRKPEIPCGKCSNQHFVPVSDQVTKYHLRGEDGDGDRSWGRSDYVAGVYPILHDDTCWFLAVDFDEAQWATDAFAYLETCRANQIPAALERSRSGHGGHVWIFFSEPIPARDARQLGACILTETLERRPEIGFASYDRLFPSQDVLSPGGFGNLIALPLQWNAFKHGNSVFVNEKLQPFPDQWAYLASLPRMAPHAVYNVVRDAEVRGRTLGVRMPVTDEDSHEPWSLPPSGRVDPKPITDPLPLAVKIVQSDCLYIDRSALPPAMIARLVRLAAFQNPEFYRAQAMRFPTYDKPRIVSCASLHPRHVELPRNCMDEAVELLRSHNVEAEIEDLRERGSVLECRFLGNLRSEQQAAVSALIPHDCGVLAATTAFGKTVVAAALIAQRGCNTLILVHRKQLLTQWIERLGEFLSVGTDLIGRIGGGRRKPTGRIDVALIQSLVRKGQVSDLIAGYGHLVVDECHHLSATSFESVAKRSKARYVLGLSATLTRKDGHHPIIFMQCGPVRHRVDARSQAARRGFDHKVRVRETAFRAPPEVLGDRVSITVLYAALTQDETRNTLIFDDVLKALDAGRSPLILTERRDHLEALQRRLERFTPNLVVLHGGMKAKERAAAQDALTSSPKKERLVLATGRHLGEGFDDSRLDTLFLVMPISWRGTLAQYVGRLHRDHDGKRDVIVYDYVDAAVPMLARMAAKRAKGYKALGYNLEI